MGDIDFGIQISDNEHIVFEDSFYNYGRKRKSYKAWYHKDGRPVAMLRYLIGGEEYDLPSICDIEVREDSRGQGLGLYLIKLIEENILDGGLLYTSGGFTPEGFKALGGKVPVYPWENQNISVKYRSMTFIHNWDACETND